MTSIHKIIGRDPDTKARNGLLTLPHGMVETPAFMPVGTNGTVKAMKKEELSRIGYNLILANTYHLYLRPGNQLIKKAGGLHAFTGWTGNILTDSGGFQVFSLSKLRKISDDGVLFSSHIDGSKHMFTPEKVVEIQTDFGSDIFMQLDVCTPWKASEKEASKALELTWKWAQRSQTHWLNTKGDFQGSLFPIVQGNFYKDLRTRSVEQICSLDMPGFAIGGLSVGEPFEVYAEYLNFTAALLPDDKPRYVMGIGTPEFILEAVENGIDMFDCVFPTRTARNGLLFTQNGPISIKQQAYTEDFSPVDSSCTCEVCTTYSRAYMRHLYKCNEILYSMLASYHNLAFLHDFMVKIRAAIRLKDFADFKKTFLDRYNRRGEL